ncbi:ribosome maturation factor RimM [Mageeibacillus indolicus]|uniref:Ribosome maturation factor RimM n=1 Tax=Mageeibacillus indolicus (strain UPII9-5) TaxID=699246 RepID=D3R2P8_MAGIU|nr:ribosome maturation factor RimM [Mageeibacillus indolicus]ADC91508.1 16S rRNA processing protein RimM [Mageeibacillus indolicus UPII9-5]
MDSRGNEALLKEKSSKARVLREFLLTAQLTAPHGIYGDMKYRILGDGNLSADGDAILYLLDRDEKMIRKVTTVWRGQGKTATVHLSQVDSREAADALRMCYLAKKRSETPPLPAGRYYVCDLIGCVVMDETGNILGHLKDILQNTAQDVYVVQRPRQKDLLFPLAPSTLQDVDLSRGIIKVKLPPGLLEIYS